MNKFIRGFYSGCVKTGNVGDDILFLIFVKFLSLCIYKKYNINCVIEKKYIPWGRDKNWIKHCSIGVVGGGSIIHPEEISYTNGIENNKDSLRSTFIFGTGISDSSKYRIPYDNRIELIGKKTDDVFFPINELMEYNINSINRAIFGGLRGPLDVKIAKSVLPNFSKSYIYDPGILMSKLIENECVHERNNIGINLADVSGDNRISKEGESYEDYMERILSVIKEFSSWCLNEGYNLYFYSLGSGDLLLHKKMIDILSINFPDNNIKIICLDVEKMEEMASVFNSFKFCISLRLHSNILVNSFNIPTICLAYNMKALNYMKSIDCEDLLIPTNEDLNFINLKNKFIYLELNYDNFVNKLKYHTNKSYEIYYTEFSKMLDVYDFNSVENIKINYEVIDNNYGIYDIEI